MSSYFNLMVTKQPIASDRERGKIGMRWIAQLLNPPTIEYNRLQQSIPPQSDPMINDPLLMSNQLFVSRFPDLAPLKAAEKFHNVLGYER